MTDILVTGAGGFIGRHLVASIGANSNVLGLTRQHGDVENPATWDGLPAVKTVVHLAGPNFVPDSWTRPASYMSSNVVGATQALEYARRHGAQMIYVSSYLYGQPDHLPIAEDAAISALSPYGLSKHLAEQVCRFYAQNLGVPVTVLRPFNIYGANQNANFLIPSVIDQALNSEEIVVQDLLPRRDYLYVADFVAAVEATLEKRFDYACFNIGSGVSHSVEDVVNIVMTASGRRVPVVSRGVRRAHEVLDLYADISLAQQELNWAPRWSLHAGCQAIMDGLRALAPAERRHS